MEVQKKKIRESMLRESMPHFTSAAIGGVSRPSLVRRASPKYDDRLDAKLATLAIRKGKDESDTIKKVIPKTDYISPGWGIEEDLDSLPAIPLFFPLDKNRTTVHDATPTEVADRIVNFLRVWSIAAKFDTDKATLRAETADHVGFYVHLYKDNDENARGILIEVRRNTGCCISFHNIARALLAASKQKDCSENVDIRRYPSGRRRSIPSSVLVDNESRHEMSLQRDVALALEFAEDLMEKDRLDANALGMENLFFLTNKETACPGFAYVAACMLLKGEDGSSGGIKKALLGYVRNMHDDDDGDNCFEERHYEIMHNHALGILSNSLQLLLEHGELRSVVETEEWLGMEGILSSLIQELHFAEVKPHDAYYAARCVNAAMEASTEAKRRAINLGLHAAMSMSQRVGSCSHALLAQESDLALTTLLGQC